MLPLVLLFYTCGLSHLFFLVFGIYFCHNWYGIKSFIKKRKKCLELICFYSSWIPSLNYGRWMHFLFCLIWSSWHVISIEIGSSALPVLFSILVTCCCLLLKRLGLLNMILFPDDLTYVYVCMCIIIGDYTVWTATWTIDVIRVSYCRIWNK